MRTASRFAPVFLLAAALVSTSACAGSYYDYDRGARYDVGRRAYENGYREGLRHGESDARDGRRFDVQRQDDYRDADEGYRRGYGDRDDYQRAYRQGFAAGYAEAYNRVAQGAYGSRYPSATPYPPYAPPSAAGPYGAYRSPASDIGYRDGYEAGRDDAHDRDRYDPIGAKRYRSGDHGYKREFGPREEYQREYRAAFQQGYDRGYRERR
ncbi:MAG: hypothetical protein ACM3SQ_11785 [Betaproteobacteria bacterium]